MKRILLAAALVGTAALAACGSSGSSGQTNTPAPPPANSGSSGSSTANTPSSGGPTSLPTDPGSVKVGSADFSENELLMYIYGEAMAAKGVQVSYKPNIGERATYIAALKDKSIGMVPEYTGSIDAYFNTKTTAKSPTDVYKELQTQAAMQGMTVAKYSPAQDSDTITVTQATASKYHLKSIGDLKPVAPNLIFGAPAQFKTRADGIPALKSVYGVVFGTFTTLKASGSVTVDALNSGTIDAGDIFSTDPSIAKNHFVPLADPKSMFAAQNIVPLFSQDVLTKPMQDACNAVSAKLDTTTLASLDAKVAGGQDAQTVAKQWLTQNKLG
jgi:osmoprotectant transport system substrate-binding protein